MPLGESYVLVDPEAQPDPESETGDLQEGVFKTIRAAVKAGGGQPIVIRPGDYAETLLLEAGEVLVGLKAARVLLAEGGEDLPPPPPEGDAGEETIITGASFHTISFLGDGKLQGLTIRQRGPGKWFGVLCAAGSPEIIACVLDGATSSCLGVCGGAAPTVTGCTIQQSFTGCGVCVFNEGQGMFEGNEIARNMMSGVEVCGHGTSINLKNNNIHSNKGSGVLVYDRAACEASGNTVFRNWHCGLEVRDDAKLAAEENEIRANNFGVLIARQGTGTLAKNRICSNFITGVDISKRNKEDEEAVSKLEGNTISYNLECGVKVWYDACAELDNNTIAANLSEVKLTPRSRRHVTYGHAEEEGGAQGLYGNNKVKELQAILHPELHAEEPMEVQDGEGAGEGAEGA